ncbi:uncharacterized protein ARMOST_11834 [Armillaria ostoyae]|uniref:Uncharacterized protein n=1 Tax=Armillaria ostoyae TaxID=47428 RepID=A0A284RI83_ARMOS|nr:uncharacterized protein ARMOST_11834 [Armillaria ostoyae]
MIIGGARSSFLFTHRYPFISDHLPDNNLKQPASHLPSRIRDSEWAVASGIRTTIMQEKRTALLPFLFYSLQHDST